MTESPSEPSDADRLLVQSEIEHYRERWSSTAHLAEQRMTMLLTAIGAAVAISAAVLVHGSSDSPIDGNALLAGVWVIVALVSEGIFIRLVRARLSISRDIAILNLLRSKLVDYSESSETKTTLEAVLAVDSSPPRSFSVTSMPSAAAVIAASSTLCAAWLADSGAVHAPPPYGYFVAGGLLVANLLAYGIMAQQTPSKVTP
jgi:hypothetical protein